MIINNFIRSNKWLDEKNSRGVKEKAPSVLSLITYVLFGTWNVGRGTHRNDSSMESYLFAILGLDFPARRSTPAVLSAGTGYGFGNTPGLIGRRPMASLSRTLEGLVGDSNGIGLIGVVNRGGLLWPLPLPPYRTFLWTSGKFLRAEREEGLKFTVVVLPPLEMSDEFRFSLSWPAPPLWNVYVLSRWSWKSAGPRRSPKKHIRLKSGTFSMADRNPARNREFIQQ